MTEAELMARVAEVQARVACALIQMEGMKAENAQRAHRGESMAHVWADFEALIETECVGSNSVIMTLRN